MKLGIFAKTFEGTDPQTVLGSVAAAGFTCAQYNMACSGLAAMPDAISEEEAHSVAAAAKASGIEIVAVSGTYNMIHPDLALREAGHRRLAILAERCAAMSTGLITLCTGTRDPLDQWKAHPDNNSADSGATCLMPWPKRSRSPIAMMSTSVSNRSLPMSSIRRPRRDA